MGEITLAQAFSHRFKVKPSSSESYSIPALIGAIVRLEVDYPLEWYTDPEGVRIESGEIFGRIVGFSHSINIENRNSDMECRRYYANLILEGCYFDHINSMIPYIWSTDVVDELHSQWFGSQWHLECSNEDVEELLKCKVHLL